MRLHTSIAAALLAACLGSLSGGAAQAQHLLLLPVNQLSGAINDPITFDVYADGNLGAAVAWGTQITVRDAVNMTYVPNFDGQGNVYRNLQPFFDTDITDTSQLITTGTLGLNFYNSTPYMNFGYNGPVYLAEFQLLLNPNIERNVDQTVTLSKLGIPPDGTQVQDEQGNGILLPTDPNNPTGNVWTSHLFVSGNGPQARWQFGFAPPADVPEPSAWLTGTAAVIAGAGLLRRKRRA